MSLSMDPLVEFLHGTSAAPRSQFSFTVNFMAARSSLQKHDQVKLIHGSRGMSKKRRTIINNLDYSTDAF